MAPDLILRLGARKDVHQFQRHVKSRELTIPCDDKILTGSESPPRTPIQRGVLKIGNRIAVQPMEGWDGTSDGNPTEPTLRRWRHFGRSGGKLIWGGEAVAVTAEGRANPNQLLIAPHTEKGLAAVGPTRRGKGTKIIALADDHSLPLAASIESASPHESQLVAGVLGHSFLDVLPTRLIGDKAYDSDRLDRDLADRYGIEMIAPHRGVGRSPTQDGRPLRRYRRRWRVERLFTWLHCFRRLVTRWKYHVENFFGMVRLGCMQILLRYL